MNTNEYDQEPLTYDEITPARVSLAKEDDETNQRIQERLEQVASLAGNFAGVAEFLATEVSKITFERVETQHWIGSELTELKLKLDAAFDSAIAKVLAVK